MNLDFLELPVTIWEPQKKKKRVPDYLALGTLWHRSLFNGVWMKRLCLRSFLVSLLITNSGDSSGWLMGRVLGCLPHRSKSRETAQAQEQLSWGTVHLDSLHLFSAAFHRSASFFPFFWCRKFSSPNSKTYDQQQPFKLLETYWSIFLPAGFPGKAPDLPS